MKTNLSNLIATQNDTILEVIGVINNSKIGICLIVENNILLGTVTDGDIRRALLSGVNLNETVDKVMNKRPVVCSTHDSLASREQKLKEFQIRHLPVLDDNTNLIGIEVRESIADIDSKDNPVFIQAGGFGKRLKPFTDNVPKPMVKIHEKSSLERIIDKFKAEGFKNFYICTHYLHNVISDHFGDGSEFDINIEYLYEEEPLGTAGSLYSLKKYNLKSPIIFINADIHTELRISNLIEYHNRADFSATICAHEYKVNVPYGVVKTNGVEVLQIDEKPTFNYFVNAGIYIFEPKCLDQITTLKKLDMDKFINKLVEKGMRIDIYPIVEKWFDLADTNDHKRLSEYFQK